MLIFTNRVQDSLGLIIKDLNPSAIFIVADRNTLNNCLPLLTASEEQLQQAKVIVVNPGDQNKSLESLASIWKSLTDNGATRSALVVNLGGGMVTDMGGFAASTFKRGLRFVNVPTTLLAAVDASVGGKTGINFAGLKNQVGAFKEADNVIISTIFFKTIPHMEILSGYAEMLKHGLLQSEKDFYRLLNPTALDPQYDPEHLLNLIEQSVRVKEKVVTEDPTEKGPRKALNLGHTAGHAFEEMAMERHSPIAHGYAVACGLVVELVLSNILLGFPSKHITALATFVRENYTPYPISCDDYPRLLELMSHDKKNASKDAINFTLLKDIGQIQLDCIATEDQIKEALDIYRDLMNL